MTTLAIALPSTPEARSYDGPLDVLLALIRRNQYPIDALPVSSITAQFLEYVRTHDLDEQLSGEFVETGSWLVLLKSRSLLPLSIENRAADPQEELRRALLDYQAVKAAAALLSGNHAHAGGPQGAAYREQFNPPAAPTLGDLLEAARQAMETAHAARSLAQAAVDELTMEDQSAWIAEQVRQIPAGCAVSATPWFETQPSQSARALLFLALLEHARRGVLLLHQRCDFGEVLIKAP